MTFLALPNCPGGPHLVPSRVSVVWVEETMAGDTPGRECPREDLGMQPLIGTRKPSGGTVSDDDSRSPCGRGALPLSGVARRPLPVDVTVAPALSVEGPRSVPSRIAVVRIDGTIAGDTPGRECPREERDWRPRAGVMRPAGVSVDDGGAGSLSGGGGRCPPRMLLKVSFRLCLLGDPPPGWCCEPCWPRWPGCCRWPRWSM